MNKAALGKEESKNYDYFTLHKSSSKLTEVRSCNIDGNKMILQRKIGVNLLTKITENKRMMLLTQIQLKTLLGIITIKIFFVALVAASLVRKSEL